MGTRSNTVVIETGNDKDQILVNIYRQMDGYLSGHGKELSEFLSEIVFVNGLGLEKSEVKYANGAGCFAAQLVAHFKDGAGGIYIDTPTKACSIGVNDYTYVIRLNTYNPGRPNVQVLEHSKQIYRGDDVGFAVLCTEEVTA